MSRKKIKKRGSAMVSALAYGVPSTSLARGEKFCCSKRYPFASLAGVI